MSSLAYHTLWLLAALAGIAVASALIARHLRLREVRRNAAQEMLAALARYSEWVAAQRRAASFGGEPPSPDSPLRQARGGQIACFPELAEAMVALMAVHERLVEFLERQDRLRIKDPEAWLESDHDAMFMALWREHRAKVHHLAERLRLIARPLVDAEPESVFPA